MPDRSLLIQLRLLLLFVVLQLVHCNLFEDPSDPEKTKISIIFKSSDSIIQENSVVDSVGKVLRMGAALYLPANFESIKFTIKENGLAILDTTCTSFHDRYFYDTVWVAHTFTTPGIKTLTLTPNASVDLSPISANITIVEENVPDEDLPDILLIAPVDTMVSITTDSLRIDLLCTDRSGIASVYASLGNSIFPAEKENGHYYIIINGFNKNNTNTIHVSAIDSSLYGNSNTKTLHIQYISAHSVIYQKSSDVTGDVPVDTNKYEKGQLVIVSGNAGGLEKTGYTFTGWNTQSDGNGTLYSGSSAFAMENSDVVLYAQWTTKSTFTVTYNGNGNTGGAVPVDGNRYEADATVTVRANSGKIVKTGSTFTGWKIESESNEMLLTAGETFGIGSSNVVLYAQWTTNPTFTVEYVGNNNTGGTVPLDPNNYEKDIIVTVKGNTGVLAKTGSSFSGWNTDIHGNGSTYMGGDTFPMGTSNVKLFAQWKTNKYTITFNSQSGSAVSSQTLEYASFITEPAAPARDGFTFGGWYKEPGCQNAWLFPTEPVFTEVTLFARWVINNVAPSMATQPAAVSVEKNSSVLLSATINSNVFPLPEYRWVRNTSDTVSSGTASSSTITFTINASAYSDEGRYKLVVRNAAGQAVSDQVDVKVKDITAPEVILTGITDTTVYLGSIWVDPKGTATDDKDGSIASSAIEISGTVNTQSVGIYQLSYKVSDQAKNVSSLKNRIVRVEGWVKVTEGLPAGNVFRAVLSSDNDLFIGLVADQTQYIYKINSNGVAVNLNMEYEICSNSLSMAMSNDNKSLYVARSCYGNLSLWNGATWTTDFPVAGVSGTSGVQVCLNMGVNNIPYLAGFFASTNTIHIRKFDGGVWRPVGDSTAFVGIELNSKRSDRKFCISSSQDLFTIFNSTSDDRDILVKKINGTSGVTTACDTIKTNGQITDNYHIVAWNIRILAGFTFDGDINPQIYRYYNGTKTILPSPAISTSTGAGGFDMEFSTDSLLHIVHPEGQNIVVRKFNGTKWLNIPECSDGIAFRASPSDVYVAAGMDRCYVVYRESTDGKVVVMQWRKQL